MELWRTVGMMGRGAAKTAAPAGSPQLVPMSLAAVTLGKGRGFPVFPSPYYY
jgi:hypothetical protein